jgi:hypothetical protein
MLRPSHVEHEQHRPTFCHSRRRVWRRDTDLLRWLNRKWRSAILPAAVGSQLQRSINRQDLPEIQPDQGNATIGSSGALDPVVTMIVPRRCAQPNSTSLTSAR